MVSTFFLAVAITAAASVGLVVWLALAISGSG